MQIKKNAVFCAAIVAVAMGMMVEAKRSNAKSMPVETAPQRNYINIKSIDQFNKQLKKKQHTVVLFFDRAEMGEKEYGNVKTAYDAASIAEMYTDKQNLQFLKVNTAWGQNHRIFEENKVLNDGDIATKPVILLFENGIMIDNQLSGNITEKRIKSFVERYFKKKNREEARTKKADAAKAKKMQNK